MSQSGIGAIPDLWEATYDLVSQVPIGRVTTYGHVARALGDVVASRFVGLAMSQNDDIVRVPCRRVVQSDGCLGGYTGGGPEKKAALLREEGVVIEGGRVKDLERVLFADFVSDQPLKRLRERQRRLRSRVKMPRGDVEARHVAGLDVAYRGEHAFAAAVVFDIRSGEVSDTLVREDDAAFPYVPTYLAFRELPLIAPLIDRLPDDTVLMYDGNGVLHPEGMGIATHAGVVFGIPTIGVAKSLLCGSLGEPRGSGEVPVVLHGRVAGFELKNSGHAKPIYVSVGHGISLRQSLAIAKRYLRYRVPEPTRAAHILASRARRATSHK